jgi:hypothetical protein
LPAAALDAWADEVTALRTLVVAALTCDLATLLWSIARFV